MTREDAKKLLMIVQTSYPNWHPPDLQFTINTWYEFLKDYDISKVQQALKAYILTDTRGFAPSIGQIVGRLHTESELGELEAWAIVYKAICNSGYHSEEEFDKLPGTIKKAVGSPANLKEWSMMPTETVQSVEQSHFIRAYRTTCERKRDNLMISGGTNERIDQTFDGDSLETHLKASNDDFL